MRQTVPTNSVADPDPGSGAFLTSGSGIRNRFCLNPGSQTHIFEFSWKTLNEVLTSEENHLRQEPRCSQGSSVTIRGDYIFVPRPSRTSGIRSLPYGFVDKR
jgi:hypothetical protein